MSILRRMSDVFQGKVNAALNAAEDPNQALDLSYEKQLELLQQVRRNVADVLTSEKRLEIQDNELHQSQQKLQGQAQQALQQGNEDLARLALTRAQGLQAQIDDLDQQIAQLKAQEQKLETLAQRLQAKVEEFRTQKETMKAQYTAAKASTQVGEAVTGLSEQMADVSMMIDRAHEKTQQMQARSAAIDQLVDSGALDQIGAGGGSSDIDRQLLAASTTSAVDAQLAAMKQQLALPEATTVVRVQGDNQYRLAQTDHDQLEQFDQRLVAAIDAGDEAGFHTALTAVLTFVRERGVKVGPQENATSAVVIPADDMTLSEAKAIMAAPATG
jgi:phage shock protein A